MEVLWKSQKDPGNHKKSAEDPTQFMGHQLPAFALNKLASQ